MGKYCCFSCPKGDFTEKRLEDLCPTCNKPYGFPLMQPPTSIGEYNVLRPLQRGFYGATYVVEHKGPLKTKQVLKVIPVQLYSFFKKDFEAECVIHNQIAENADHVVRISGLLQADVNFGEITIPCHVAVLAFVDGPLLGTYLRGEEQTTSSVAAQVAADLFRMKAEIERHLVNHNDLHADNIIIEQLTPGRYRQGAMDPSVRAVAIDLGSVQPDRRSGGIYRGDLHWIAIHIHGLTSQLLADLDNLSDLDARVGHALQMVAQIISPPVESQRTPEASDFVRLIEQEYFRTAEPWRPWREQLKLRTFGSSYNAQTLDAWHVPQLLVDPEGAWLAQISAPGPLIITGMRGCGKTVLLRALQFHARAARQSAESDENVLARLMRDNYIGLFVSAQRLLDVEDLEAAATGDHFARLYVAYALEAARALAHLDDLNRSLVKRDAYSAIASAVEAVLTPKPDRPGLATIEQLERYLGTLLIRVSRADSGFSLGMHPTNAFPILADAIRRASPLWSNAQVLFLLDDVSTRYMTADRIESLLSALIFQNSTCAFKVTSEAQTIFLSLKSPGQVNPAAPWRDFQTFDLGAEVHTRLRNYHSGKRFVEEILRQRAQFFANHPPIAPSQILGDFSYEDMARTIAASSPESGDRKRVYRGLTALTGMCVGDIGSVIKLYEDILERAGGQYPVPDTVQAEAFQDLCAWHLYLLDRRGGHLKDVARSFAEAAHELLVRSGRGRARRLRQFASIYVKVTSGDFEEQRKRLRELVDAGVFVFTGGAPRARTRDSNPTQQFKLTYRKIYGLVNFIGLAERDRFELSGSELEEWLMNPSEGKEILMRNHSPKGDPDDMMPADEAMAAGRNETPVRAPIQLSLSAEEAHEPITEGIENTLLRDARLPVPDLREVELKTLGGIGIDNLVIGLGFEDRTPVSVDRILAELRPKRVIAVTYDEPGKSEEILATLKSRGISHTPVSYGAVRDGHWPSVQGKSLVDVTGLAKPVIFKSVREALRREGTVAIVYTAAAKYYPLDRDLNRILEAEKNANRHQLLLSLKDVLMGETGPYKLVPLLPVESDVTRMRSLCAFASSKHERLLHLIEAREYDHMDIMVDDSASPRSRIAEIAAEVAIRENVNASISKRPYLDPSALLEAIALRYQTWFIRDGLNFEFGLTGSKIQAVTAALLSATAHVNQVWYVSPAEFDKHRFTSGVGDTKCFIAAAKTTRHEVDEA